MFGWWEDVRTQLMSQNMPLARPYNIQHPLGRDAALALCQPIPHMRLIDAEAASHFVLATNGINCLLESFFVHTATLNEKK